MLRFPSNFHQARSRHLNTLDMSVIQKVPMYFLREGLQNTSWRFEETLAVEAKPLPAGPLASLEVNETQHVFHLKFNHYFGLIMLSTSVHKTSSSQHATRL